MRAVLCHEFGNLDAVRPGEAPDPVPASDEVLIDVAYTAATYMDYLMADGCYQRRRYHFGHGFRV